MVKSSWVSELRHKGPRKVTSLPSPGSRRGPIPFSSRRRPSREIAHREQGAVGWPLPCSATAVDLLPLRPPPSLTPWAPQHALPPFGLPWARR